MPAISTVAGAGRRPDSISNRPPRSLPPAPPRSGSLQAGAISYVLFLGSRYVDAFFEGQTLPDQYTARNITTLVQTVVRGMAYLATFVFGANSVGLLGAGEGREARLAGQSNHHVLCSRPSPAGVP